jgi:hypothetical protein
MCLLQCFLSQSNYGDQPSSHGQSYVATQDGPPMSPKLYCLHCYSRTGYKYSSHGYPGKPPCNHIPAAASPAHIPSAAPAPRTKPYAQSYLSAPVPPQTHRVTFKDGFNQGVAYS